MPNKTCPLCGGKLKNNYCESCGYDVPDDDEGLSALYDMDPENDAFGEAVREITPEVQAEEIYPNRPAGFDTAYEQPKFKVRDNEGKTVHQNYQNQTPPPSPFANRGNGSGQSKQYATTGDFVKDYWWLLLLSFLAPIVGAVLLATVGRQIERKYRGIVIAAIVLGFVLPP